MAIFQSYLTYASEHCYTTIFLGEKLHPQNFHGQVTNVISLLNPRCGCLNHHQITMYVYMLYVYLLGGTLSI